MGMVPATERKTAANARGVAPGPPPTEGDSLSHKLSGEHVDAWSIRVVPWPAKRTSGRYRISLGWLDKFAGIAANEVRTRKGQRHSLGAVKRSSSAAAIVSAAHERSAHAALAHRDCRCGLKSIGDKFIASHSARDHHRGSIMPRVVVQYVSKPRPGSNLATILEIAKEAAAIWRKHGGNVTYWSIMGGEVGNLAFTVGFESFEDYGRVLAAVFADPATAEWQAKRLKAGQSDWVRANTAFELEL